MSAVVWIDGAFVAGPLPDDGSGGLFETIGARGDRLPLWDRHLGRLQQGRARLGDPSPPPQGLLAAVTELLRRNGDDVVRLERLVRPRGGSWRAATRRRAAAAGAVRLIPTVTPRPADAPPGDLKALPRTFQDAVLREARLGGADDGVVLGDDGAVLETSVGNLWLLLDGVWTTPPLDGRVLPGIGRAVLLERAAAGGLAVRQARCDLGDLHRAEALAVSNAVHGPRAAVLVGASGESETAIVGQNHSLLATLWRSAVPD